MAASYFLWAEVTANTAELNANDPISCTEAYRVFAESDLADQLHSIPRRMLAMTGGNDVGSNPRMAWLTHEKIVASPLAILPNLGHSVAAGAPDEVAGDLPTFLRLLRRGHVDRWHM